ncbi:MAG: oligosaccharide flippase family protein [Phycisphaerales bacterium]|nr:oligosaccharide flippase family protein [Phycisphaerales bacterium]MCB9835364.1 oligosaccharide flippase family protein [Phycisphaera sp.]
MSALKNDTLIESASPIDAMRPPKKQSLKATAVKASMWTMGGFALGNFLRLVSNIILAYLLVDNIGALGLMALVNAFLQGLRMFSDVGFNLGLIQHQRGEDKHFVSTAWTLQVIRGVVLYTACWIFAIPFANYYGEPILAQLIPVTGVITLLNGCASSGMVLAKRNLDVKKLTLIELGTQSAGLVVMMVLAFQHASVWALVAGNITGAVFRTVVSHIVFSEHRAAIGWSNAAAKDLLRFGGWIFVATILTFVTSQIDKLAFGKVFNVTWLGIYGVAATFSTVPMQAVMRLGNQVVFPTYAKVINRGEDLSKVLDRVRQPVLVATGLAASGMFAAGPWAVELLYPVKFYDAGWMLQILAVGMLMRVLSETSKAALMAIGKPRAIATGQVMKIIGFVVLTWVGYRYWGMMGFIAGVALSDCFQYASMAINATQRGLHVLPKDARTCWLTVVSSALGMFAGTFAASFIGHNRGAAVAGVIAASLMTGLFWLRPLHACYRDLRPSR